MDDHVSASASASPDPDSTARRSRSGRVVKAPTKFAPEATAPSASKRKRDDHDGDDADDADPLSDDDMSDEPDAASDDDHPAPRSSRKPSQGARPKKPSSKKPKINGTQPVASGHVARIPSRPKKTVRIDAGEKGTGVFADIFGSGDTPEAVSQQWLERYRQDDAAAMSDLVNCILQCAGCDLEVTTDDIRDPENIPNRLVDLQNVYQEQQITEYPLISRAKNTRSFREMLIAFFHSLISLLHETDVLYKDPDLMDNLHAWLASMSSSTLRPFRHTATTVALSVQAGLIDIAGVLDRRIATIEQQSLAAKKGKNKSKAAEIQRGLTEANGYRKTCSEAIQSFFDTVFVHRYRDVDPKIRTECVEALGSWIWNLPTVFMEPGYLRYLGWMLSDTNAPTRQEVLKQLHRVFKRDAQQLGHFIDRFRPRLIEMATLDSEVPVRVAAINVIDTLRAAALLEPNEIDAIGKLIFDTELRIRKAVVNFFVACIEDVHEGKLEEMGGADALDEIDDADEDDFESPRKEWVNIKCLSETLAIYDAQIEESQHDGAVVDLDAAADLLEAAVPDTRISLAAHVLYEKLPEVKTWELLAGYLLFDHTTSTKSRPKSNAAANSTEAAFKRAVAPTSAEESILLDVLCSAIKSSLAQTSEHDRNKRRGHRSEAAEAQEETALELTTVIPKLLNKFGAEPETAAIVLRLEHCLNLDVFQQLRQDASKYEKLLDEISTQFNRHDDKRVLSEATSALLHARQYEELEELTDSKLSLLWENVINALRNFDKTCELSIRDNLAAAPLRELSTTLLKIGKLASVSDCVDALEATPRSNDSNAPAIEILSNIVHRGKFEPQEDEIDDLEDEVVSFAIKACQFYFMWKTRALSQLLLGGASISDAELDRLSVLRQTYRRHLIETFSSRAAIDQLRLYSTGSLCDLHLTFATLRRLLKGLGSSSSPGAQQPRADKLRVLMQEIEPGLVPELMSIFDGAEKQYARKAKKDKTLNEPAEDEDPLADDEELDDDDDDEGLSKEERYTAELRAEKALCELTAKYVLAITADLFDNRGSQAGKLRRRILRNKAKLGNNFKEVVAYLEGDNLMAGKRPKKPAAAAAAAKSNNHPSAGSRKAALSEETVHDDDDHDDEEEEEEHDEDSVLEDVEPEEGSREDLRRRELLDDDPIEDGEDEPEPLADDIDDDVLGD
ncbi:STAG domain-containing protein [Hirsutella rhossiliensis]|uniref:STAG domain-containing protein n=1 Tax=Hirsutella rhossiliensis TaxID=111463 RepID=A0A9P8N181_9HYPO|nr:STAG domain-containing protein [Hirsutella rhossiliensis]KAH0964995.1 STAG domain-containing protein [Hirsutella rhossiliensis]